MVARRPWSLAYTGVEVLLFIAMVAAFGAGAERLAVGLMLSMPGLAVADLVWSTGRALVSSVRTRRARRLALHAYYRRAGVIA